MASTAQSWIFETPGRVNATIPVNITWSPNTFNAKNYGNFSLNLWLLRKDSTKNIRIENYPPFLIKKDHNVFDQGIIWTPTSDDIDLNVPQAGTHQMTWERTEKNPDATENTSFEGFSQGFNIVDPNPESSSTSTASSTGSPTNPSSIPETTDTTTSSQATPTTPRSDPSTSQTSLPAAEASGSGSGVSQSTVVGLAVGLGMLALACIIVILFWIRHRRRQKQRAEAVELSMPPVAPLPYYTTKDPRDRSQAGYPPVELDDGRGMHRFEGQKRIGELDSSNNYSSDRYS